MHAFIFTLIVLLHSSHSMPKPLQERTIENMGHFYKVKSNTSEISPQLTISEEVNGTQEKLLQQDLAIGSESLYQIIMQYLRSKQTKITNRGTFGNNDFISHPEKEIPNQVPDRSRKRTTVSNLHQRYKRSTSGQSDYDKCCIT